MSNLIETTLAPLRVPFVIPDDGSSQTMLSNLGRVGFFIENKFGIQPNKSRQPDFGTWELKTLKPGKKVSIGTMPEFEFNNIVKRTSHVFSDSEPYKKMKNTIFVFYDQVEHYPEPQYVVTGWQACKLENLPGKVSKDLNDDYENICEIVRLRGISSRDYLTSHLIDNGSLSGKYLSLGYKGAGRNGYNYPAWSFQTKFTKLFS
jgi:hypothetical protein